jgi:Ca-activated chloride channel family protein
MPELKYQQPNNAAPVDALSNDLVTLKVRYKSPDRAHSVELQHVVPAADTRETSPSNNLAFASSVAEFAMLLKQSEHRGAASFQNALQRARLSKGADELGYRANFIQLVETASLIAGD